MHVVVFGAGSLGSLLGGLLVREHDVTLVGREPHVGTVTESGLDITGAIETHVTPAARREVPDGADLALVTVKSYDTAEAARALGRADPDAVLSVQNGLGNEQTLAAEVEGAVLAGTCTYGARLVEPGVVECTGLGTITLGPHSGGRSAVTERIGEAFDTAGIETVLDTEMPRRLWEKLAINAGINATTALARVKNGALAASPAGDVAAEAARETVRVARSNGIELDERRVVEELTQVIEATAPNRSSMYQDVAAGERTEIDAINGAVVERASGSVPVNETLTALVESWEHGREIR